MHFSGLEESAGKACPPSTQMTFIGVLFDTNSLILKITPERLAEIQMVVTEWLLKEEATLKELQSLLGKLNFVAHCVKPARIFIARLLNFLRQIHNSEKPIKIPSETKKDLLWWSHFLPRYNGISMMDLEEWGTPDSVLSCDSCLVSCGGYFEGRVFHCRFPKFIIEKKLHINALELLTICLAVKLWGPLLRGKKLVVNCDNSNSVLVLSHGYSKDPFMQACLREIYFVAAINEFQIRGNSVSGVDNRISDYLSRWYQGMSMRDLFYKETSTQCIVHEVVPESLFMFLHDW